MGCRLAIVGVLYEGDLSGDGMVTFSGGAIDHIRTHVTTMPLHADALDATAPEEVLRVGWISLGGTYAEGTEGTLTYNFEKLWIDFMEQFFWTSVPAHPADHLRYRIYQGGIVHVLVVD